MNERCLGSLAQVHELQLRLLDEIPEEDVSCQYIQDSGSLAWWLGRSVYLETFWLREVIQGDDDLTARVAEFFVPGSLSLDEQCARLPSREHLLYWARDIFDENLRQLATSGALPEHPLLTEGRLGWYLLDQGARCYETMLQLLVQRRLTIDEGEYRVQHPLVARWPKRDSVTLQQGHYRVGARDDPAARDSELPPQLVQLGAFDIARRPVSQAEFLAFMDDGGYTQSQWWTSSGWSWRAGRPAHPWAWRRDQAGHWYLGGLQGPGALLPDEPVWGISRHEAEAFAAWVAARVPDMDGCVLQHEYQWEVAARSQLLEETGRVWEWCANAIHPYDQYVAYPAAQPMAAIFTEAQSALRGACLHSQPHLRRLTVRHWQSVGTAHGFQGLRLVFPPAPLDYLAEVHSE